MNRFLILTGIFLMAVIPAVAQSVRSDSLYAIGVDLYNRGEYSSAAQFFEECDRLDKAELDSLSPRRDYASWWLGSCYHKLGMRDKAIASAGCYHSLPPVDRRLTVKIDSLSFAGVKAMMQNLPSLALIELREVNALELDLFGPDHPANISTNRMLSQCLAATQRFPEALTHINESQRLIRLHYSDKDTLLIPDNILKYNIHISRMEFEEAQADNQEFADIVKANYPSGHPGNIEVGYRALTLLLSQRKWQDARELLPEYIGLIKRCLADMPDQRYNCFQTVRMTFENCGQAEAVAEIDALVADNVDSMSDDNQFTIKFQNLTALLNAREYDKVEEGEKELYTLINSAGGPKAPARTGATDCLRCLRLMALMKEDEAKDLYISIRRNADSGGYGNNELFYPIFQSIRVTMSMILSDFEDASAAINETMGALNPVERENAINIRTMHACMVAFSGNYRDARSLTDSIASDYRRLVIDRKAAYRLEKDTAELNRTVGMIQNYILASGNMPDSVRYTLRDIKCSYLELKADLLRILPRYAIGYDYFDCMSDHALELIRMQKYIEAQEVMDRWLADWNTTYSSIPENSGNEKDAFDRLEACMSVEEGLFFRCRNCYEKGDPAGETAYQDFLKFIRNEYGEDSEEYAGSLYLYYDFKGDRKARVDALLSVADHMKDDITPKFCKMAAEAFSDNGQPEEAVGFFKLFVKSGFQDPEYLSQNKQNIMNAISSVISYHLERTDTLGALSYLRNEFWPVLDSCEDGFPYFIESLNLLQYKVKDESFIPFVEEEVRRRPEFYDSDSKLLVVMHTIAGILNTTHQTARTLEFIDKGAELIKGDEVLGILLGCIHHRLLKDMGKEYAVTALSEGKKLMDRMKKNRSYLFTHEYASLVERQLELLEDVGRFDEIVSLGKEYLKDFEEKEYSDLAHILNESHPDYASVRYLNDNSLHDFSVFAGKKEAHDRTYIALCNLASSEASDYALLRIHDEYENLKISMSLNDVSLWQTEGLINFTGKLAYRHQTDSLLMYAYDAALLCKGLQLRSDHAIRAIIQRSGHRSALRKFDELQNVLRQLPNASDEELKELKDKRQSLEKDLFRLSRSFGDYSRSLYTSWKAVRDELRPEDIAIEFIQINPEYDDIYRINKSGLEKGYYACLLRRDWNRPEIVYLTHPDSVSITPDIYSTPALSATLLTPLEPYLKGVSTIYFSPYGELNRIALESLPDPSNPSRTLSSRYSLYRLSSTRELVERDRLQGEDAVIYGGLNYNTSVATLQEDALKYPAERSSGMSASEIFTDNDYRGMVKGVRYLEGSRIEAENVALTINSGNHPTLHAIPMLGDVGTEASFKALGGARKSILHIATHGFFLEEENVKLSDERNRHLNKEDKSLMRSGLLLAGAENRSRGIELPEGVDDGILTSQEIANIDLAGLDLCVLSACETARGDINSEGVYGLQRGFKKAGANSILMSLWKVNDEATCMLMTEFYRNWIVDGLSKTISLEKAKEKVRSHKEKGWDNPKYWSAFILLDALD